jgi:hypothetical protein
MDIKDCHLTIGHGGAFSYYNPNVVSDAHQALHRSDERLGVESNARKHRLPVAPPSPSKPSALT